MKEICKKKTARLKAIKREKATNRFNKHGKAGPHSSKKGDAGYDRRKEKEIEDDDQERLED